MAEATVTVDEHLPVRPTWACSCGAPEWPDEAAKTAMEHEFAGNRTSFSVYLANRWIEAVDDMPNYGVERLYDRIVDWHRRHAPAWRRP